MGYNGEKSAGRGNGVWRLKLLFFIAVLAVVFFIIMTLSATKSTLVNTELFIPPYVVFFSLIGGLMYLFASTVSEWIDKQTEYAKDQARLDEFNALSFWAKLKLFNFERKLIRGVLAAPLMAIGIFLLFDILFPQSGITNNIAPGATASTSLMNATVDDLAKAMGQGTEKDVERLIKIKAGISFLAGAYVKQFLSITKALPEKLTR